MEIKIDENALVAMESLLADQFDATLTFCFSEFTRLHGAFLQSLDSQDSEAIRNIHSLKSNAAQFGAVTLADTARRLEQGLSQGERQSLQQDIDSLDEVIASSVVQMKQWQQQS
ncbi:Hpt domain-containing protein [Pseudoalteromonas sp. MM17-2]|uniref:Hpt domain-containing protein n=1 Tax=Pseudoalteromonas sp. MM17-2 TaxID=2917753 RepID=UPI001EF44335|nr:Hpt domain-containing protein [Pseudoalteromonas sp. MM17-2]MCG7544439.1 Hpt domain-containing protein [Pseudoalteromonas sp. MM17-2]